MWFFYVSSRTLIYRELGSLRVNPSTLSYAESNEMISPSMFKAAAA